MWVPWWWGTHGGEPLHNWKTVTNFFLRRFWWKFHTRLFLDSKHFLNFLNSLKKKCKLNVHLMMFWLLGNLIKKLLDSLSMVLTVIENAGFKLKQNKCTFLVDKIEYLWILLGSDGIKTDLIESRFVIDAKSPTNVKELRAFLGAVTHYNKFLKNLPQSTQCLKDLLKKNRFGMWKRNLLSKYKIYIGKKSG